MSDVPHLKIHSIDKNVLGTKSATSSVDFLLKGLPPFWLQRLWQVCNRVLIAADLRRAIADRLRISDLPKFILLSTLYILYRLKLRLPRNNPSPSIRTGENLVLRKTYFLKDFLTGNWKSAIRHVTPLEEKAKMVTNGYLKDCDLPRRPWPKRCCPQLCAIIPLANISR